MMLPGNAVRVSTPFTVAFDLGSKIWPEAIVPAPGLLASLPSDAPRSVPKLPVPIACVGMVISPDRAMLATRVPW